MCRPVGTIPIPCWYDMAEVLSEQLIASILQLAAQCDLPLGGGDRRFEYLAGDGSDRLFVRISHGHGPSCLAVLPNGAHPHAMAEARSYYQIGKFLFDRGVPVPQVFGYDETTGIVLVEDLGNVLLHELIEKHTVSSAIVWQRYQDALEALVKLQLAGRKGFSADYCWDTAQYDTQVMLEREANYFQIALCENYLGINNFDGQLKEEFLKLAERAAREPANFLLHRDFQSRNLMIYKDSVRIIDFQGARFGPLGYDVASLLVDPYAGLTPGQQDELLDYYCNLQEHAQHALFDRQGFLEGYFYLFLQRNLQILGAFAFLSQEKGKTFFTQHIKPAAVSLSQHLDKPQGETFPALRSLAGNIVLQLQNNSKV